MSELIAALCRLGWPQFQYYETRRDGPFHCSVKDLWGDGHNLTGGFGSTPELAAKNCLAEILTQPSVVSISRWEPRTQTRYTILAGQLLRIEPAGAPKCDGLLGCGRCKKRVGHVYGLDSLCEDCHSK